MTMTSLDWMIVAFVALLALFGFRQGFIVGVLSFGGFALGAFLGTRLGPLLLPQGASSPYAPAFGLVGALLAGAILASGLEGLGWRLRRSTLVVPGVGLFDGALGAALSAVVGLGIVWIVAAVAAQIPGQGQLRGDIQRSAILRRAQPFAAPLGPDPRRAGTARSTALDSGPAAGAGPAAATDRRRPGCAGRRGQRGPRAGDRLRPRRSRAPAGWRGPERS